MHDQLPGNTQKLMGPQPERELARKSILFYSFPATWRDKFVENHDGYHLPGNTWQFILRKMAAYEQGDENRRLRSQPRHIGRQPAARRGGRTAGGRGHGRMHYYGGRGQNQSPQGYHPYPNSGYGNYQRHGQRSPNQGYPPRNGNNGNYNNNGGRGRFSNNNRFQGRFQGRNGGRGRFQPRQQYHYQQSFHAEEMQQDQPQNEQFQYQTGSFPGADSLSTDSYYGSTAGAVQHDADEHQQRNNESNENYDDHYGYDRYENGQEDAYENLYGGGFDGDY